MTAQVTLWRANGTFVEYPPATDDAGRGQSLLAAVTAAIAGDLVVVGPGNYLKPYPNDITEDGVRLHLLPGARIYDTNRSMNVPVINVTSGTHWLSGHGIIEHLGTDAGVGSAAAGIFVRGTGTLICEADQIISTSKLNSAVKVAGPVSPSSPPATLSIRTRRQHAWDYDAFEVGRGTCLARIQHAVSGNDTILGDTDANAIEVSSTADLGQVRVIEVQRAESNHGYTLFLSSIHEQCNLYCQSVFAYAAVPIRCISADHYTRLGHISAAVAGFETVQMVAGRLFVDQVEQKSGATAIEVSINVKLFAHQVLQSFVNSDGIKIMNTVPDFEAVVDVGAIN